MAKRSEWILGSLVTLAVSSCNGGPDPGVSTPASPWCDGARCEKVTLDRLFSSPPAANLLCVRINGSRPGSRFLRIPLPQQPRVQIDLPADPATGKILPLDDIEILAVMDDRVDLQEDAMCRAPACIAADVKLARPTVTDVDPTLTAELLGREVNLKMSATPEDIGLVTSTVGPDKRPGAMRCGTSWDKDRKGCTETVPACTEVRFQAVEQAGKGVFSGWSTGSDRSCQSNLNPLRVLAGLEPGGKAAGISLEPYCGTDGGRDSVTARFLAGKCGPNSPSDKCTVCNPIDALDPGEGTWTCDAKGALVCGNVKRKTVVLDGSDLWLSHECGKAVGKEWSQDFPDKGTVSCVMQKGPRMTLPPGRYVASAKGWAQSLLEYNWSKNDVEISFEVVGVANVPLQPPTVITTDLPGTRNTPDRIAFESPKIAFLISSGCQPIELKVTAKSIGAGTDPYGYYGARVVLTSTTITPID